MAVYTVLNQRQIADFIRHYDIGSLCSFEGIAGGLENTNYFIKTSGKSIENHKIINKSSEYVLTLFETVTATELSFYVALTTYLHQQQLPVPCAVTDTTGVTIHELQDKPAILVPRAPGKHPEQATPAQCRTIASTLARCHLACLNWPEHHQGIRSYSWLKAAAQTLAPQITADERQLLKQLSLFEAILAQHPALPKAVIHGDLFRDNTLFIGDNLTALLDFYSAGYGFLLMDLAVVVNDWCSRDDGSLEPELTNNILQAYQAIRPLTADEKLLWNRFLIIAALRFWISRRLGQLHSNPDSHPEKLVVSKDPNQYHRILQQRIEHPQPTAWRQ